MRKSFKSLRKRIQVLSLARYIIPNKENPLIKIDIKERLQTGEGFVGMYTYGGGITNKWADLRRKIEEGISHLHPDFPGVIIFRPHGLDYLEYDIKNALYGDLSINFGRNSGNKMVQNR